MRTISLHRDDRTPLAILTHPIDEVGANERADSFTKRSIKKESKLAALYTALSMCDLTTLEGADTPGKIRQLCHKARYPVPPDLFNSAAAKKGFPPIPSVAAVCVYPSMVRVAVKALEGSGIQIASVSTAFPSGQAPLDVKIRDTKFAVESRA